MFKMYFKKVRRVHNKCTLKSLGAVLFLNLMIRCHAMKLMSLELLAALPWGVTVLGDNSLVNGNVYSSVTVVC